MASGILDLQPPIWGVGNYEPPRYGNFSPSYIKQLAKREKVRTERLNLAAHSAYELFKKRYLKRGG